MEKYERVFNVIGWFGFLLIVPVGFYIFDYQPAIQFMQTKIGFLGNPSFLTIAAFVLLFLRIIFGGGQIIMPLIVSFIAAFFLFFSVVEVGFMHWFWTFSRKVFFLKNLHLNFIVGTAVLLIGVFLSYLRRFKGCVQLVLLVVIPIVFLSASNLFGLFVFPNPIRLSVQEGVEGFKSWIKGEYQDDPAVKQYIEEVADSRDLTIKEKEAIIRKLQGKIDKLETDLTRLEEIRRENEQFREELERQKRDLDEFDWCSGSRVDGAQVQSYQQAVHPEKPCVRDFAVHLAKNYDGPYFVDTDRFFAPGEYGLKQICAIHRYISNSWSYISDPLVMQDEYYSSADRTIAVGFAGDCDDFAILMASCIEAIGGITRIMEGDCGDIGHAWCEVMIGGEQEWEAALPIIRRFYHSRFRNIDGWIDAEGNHWLSLDWRLGEYSCPDESPQIAYMSQPR